MIKQGVVQIGVTPGVDSGAPSTDEESLEVVAVHGSLQKTASIAELGDLIECVQQMTRRN